MNANLLLALVCCVGYAASEGKLCEITAIATIVDRDFISNTNITTMLPLQLMKFPAKNFSRTF